MRDWYRCDGLTDNQVCIDGTHVEHIRTGGQWHYTTERLPLKDKGPGRAVDGIRPHRPMTAEQADEARRVAEETPPLSLADLLVYCRAELEESYGGRYDGFADVIRWIEEALPKATTDGVQIGVQRDPTEPRITQVRAEGEPE